MLGGGGGEFRDLASPHYLADLEEWDRPCIGEALPLTAPHVKSTPVLLNAFVPV